MQLQMVALSIFLATTVPGCEDCRDSLPVSPSSVSVSNLAEAEENKGETVNPISEAMEVAGNLFGSQTATISPSLIRGIELATIRGWWAILYPWEFIPEQSPVHPIPELFTPYQRQSVAQIQYQEKILNVYGSGLDVLQLGPGSYDFTHWQSAYFPYSRRPFFVAYEHVFNENYIPPAGPKDMNNLVNRQAFMRDIKFLFDNVITLYQSRYVTVNGRAVIYMWSTTQMVGDFASLLDEARNKYPIFFIGSGEDLVDVERIKSLDGIMEYSIAGFGGAYGDYQMMISSYFNHSRAWRSVLDSIQSLTGKKIYLIPTFQAAYDDSLVQGRSNKPLYPKSRAEVVEHARNVQYAMTRWKIFDNLGPFVVWSELPEGGSVIPSVFKPEQVCNSNDPTKYCKYVGYGTGRIEIVAQYFRRR